MKYTKYLLLTLALFAFASCQNSDEQGSAATNISIIEMEAVGGVEKVAVNMSNRWIVSTDNPWISVSPANGVGATVCQFKIDSALTATPRSGVVRIQNLDTWEEREIEVRQAGFDYTIEVEDADISVKNYGEFGKRYFDVKVKSNVEFDVKIPEDATRLTHDDYTLTLDRGMRPRQTTIRFNWNNNTRYEDRLAEVKFVPKKSVEMHRNDVVSVLQSGAEPIKADTRAGDSTALVCIARSLQVMSPWDTSAPMNEWTGVTLWEEGMEGCTPEKVGRVKSAEFYIFFCKESLPFEVRYLTAA
ncbi:MAG: BACON domain-containing protein, partial [Alistipes sp.]|nr:BACON domain-containing protein [Alistipes sp.]